MSEFAILQETLNWYLEHLSPETESHEISEQLFAIQSAIDNHDVEHAVDLLVQLYEMVPQLHDLISAPGPTGQFRQLVTNLESQHGGFSGFYDYRLGQHGNYRRKSENKNRKTGNRSQIGRGRVEQKNGHILRDTMSVDKMDYKVLGLLLQSPDGRLYLYDPKVNDITYNIQGTTFKPTPETENTQYTPPSNPFVKKSITRQGNGQGQGQHSPIIERDPPIVKESKKEGKDSPVISPIKKTHFKLPQRQEKEPEIQYEILESSHVYDVVPPEKSTQHGQGSRTAVNRGTKIKSSQ